MDNEHCNDTAASFRVSVDTITAAFTLEAAGDGEEVNCTRAGVLYPWDGEIFYTVLDSLLEGAIGMSLASRGLHPYAVPHLLVWQSKPDEMIVVPAQSLEVRMQVLALGNIQKGTALQEADIGRIVSLEFPGFEIPKTGTFAFLTSFGSRKALAFDFRAAPMHLDKRAPAFRQLACRAMNGLRFRHQMQTSAEVWDKMVAKGWYFFMRLGPRHVANLTSCFSTGKNIAGIEASIVKAFSVEHVQKMMADWWDTPYMAEHRRWIEHGVHEYCQGDLISAVSVLVPRVEGVLRSILKARGVSAPGSHLALLKKVRQYLLDKDIPIGGFFAERFVDYLDRYTLGKLDFTQAQIPFSRHSLSHGVADADLVSAVRALQVILTLDEIRLSFSEYNSPAESKESD